MDDEKFVIKNEYLIQAMWGGNIIDNCCFKYCRGYFNDDEKRLGRQFLEYCLSVVFGIHRLPGLGLGYSEDIRWAEINRCLDPVMISDACNELRELYAYTQERLKRKKIKTLNLKRALNPFEVESITQKPGQDDLVLVEANVISSYTCDHKIYPCRDYVVRDVGAENIVLYDRWITYPDRSCLFERKDSEDELWVIETNVFGYTEVRKEDVHLLNQNIDEKIAHNRAFGYLVDQYGQLNEPLLLKSQPKPCTFNRLTEILVNRNAKKLGMSRKR